MLPGFRFLFAAIVLSMSILVFGLGAAALLRAAHEQFASNPSWHVAPEGMFAQRAETTTPVLALLRVNPPAAGPKRSDDVAAATPVEQESNLSTPAEQAPAVAAPTEPSQVAALKPEETPPPEVAKSESPAPESPAPESPAREGPAPSEAAAQSDAPASANTAAPDTDKLASTEQISPPAQDLPPNAAPVVSEPAAAVQASPSASPEPDAASTKIATLGGPTVVIETPPAKAESEKPDRSAIKQRQQARRAAHRRRLAARARLAARQALQQPANPFAQPSVQSPVPAR